LSDDQRPLIGTIALPTGQALQWVAILACVMPGEGRRSQVLGIIRQSRAALDDDQIAQAAQMNPVYVNMICRQLASDGLIVRAQVLRASS
jgi:hypothetical protein